MEDPQETNEVNPVENPIKKFVPRQAKRTLRRSDPPPPEHPPSSNLFTQFNDEVLFHIFTMLDRSSLEAVFQVNKQFFNAIHATHTGLDLTQGNAKALAVRRSLSSYTNLRTLIVPYQQAIILSQTIADTCPNLENLFFLPSSSATHTSTSLPVSQTNPIPDVKLKGIISSCKSLKSIDLSNCTKITDKSISNIAFDALNLQNISLRGCDLITNKSVLDLLHRNTPQGDSIPLTHLDISDCPLLSRDVLKTIGTACSSQLHSLSILSLQGNTQFTPHDLTYLVAGGAKDDYVSQRIDQTIKMEPGKLVFSYVQRLDISRTNVNDMVLEFLLNSLLYVRMISLASCPNITDTSLHTIATFSSDTLKFVDLRRNPQLSSEILDDLRVRRNWVIWGD
ncbi:hypothetical protein BLNAU_11893 [Blattamonas nauphoetae]|uniref:F-box/LRR-repeat protein 15-like leucin rich repeat domain-containing protein n=1 Tax=Blattamonas nauphoetae TaxID=2049346 RepID=A0ABQ9XKZ9_9EUKA|nr:hypothetical protein BLNAU_11893 [Blattamonas nauphoetae]